MSSMAILQIWMRAIHSWGVWVFLIPELVCLQMKISSRNIQRQRDQAPWRKSSPSGDVCHLMPPSSELPLMLNEFQSISWTHFLPPPTAKPQSMYYRPHLYPVCLWGEPHTAPTGLRQEWAWFYSQMAWMSVCLEQCE